MSLDHLKCNQTFPQFNTHPSIKPSHKYSNSFSPALNTVHHKIVSQEITRNMQRSAIELRHTYQLLLTGNASCKMFEKLSFWTNVPSNTPRNGFIDDHIRTLNKYHKKRRNTKNKNRWRSQSQNIELSAEKTSLLVTGYIHRFEEVYRQYFQSTKSLMLNNISGSSSHQTNDEIPSDLELNEEEDSDSNSHLLPMSLDLRSNSLSISPNSYSFSLIEFFMPQEIINLIIDHYPSDRYLNSCSISRSTVHQYCVEMNDLHFQLIHIHKLRKIEKWLHVFDQIYLILYCIDLASYVKYDGCVNVLQQSLIDLKDLLNNRKFNKIPIVLLYTNYDVFQQTVKTMSLQMCFEEYRTQFYVDDGELFEEIENAFNFIKDKFSHILMTSNRKIFSHVIISDDSKEKILQDIYYDVQNIIIKSNLNRSGLICR